MLRKKISLLSFVSESGSFLLKFVICPDFVCLNWFAPLEFFVLQGGICLFVGLGLGLGECVGHGACV